MKILRSILISLVILIVGVDISIAQPINSALQSILQPSLEKIKGYHNFRCMYTEQIKDYYDSDTAKYIWNLVVAKRPNESYYFKKESSSYLIISDSLGTFGFSKPNQEYEDRYRRYGVKDNIVETGFLTLFPEFTVHILKDSVILIDSLSDLNFYIIKTFRKSSPKHHEGQSFIFWLNKKSLIIERMSSISSFDKKVRYQYIEMRECEFDCASVLKLISADLRQIDNKSTIDSILQRPHLYALRQIVFNLRKKGSASLSVKYYESQDDSSSTINYQFDCKLFRLKKDSIFGGLIWLTFNKENNITEDIYNGKSFYHIDHKSKHIEQYSDGRKMENWIMEGMHNFFFLKPAELLSIVRRQGNSCNIKDTTVIGIPYLMLSVSYKGNSGEWPSSEVYLINKESGVITSVIKTYKQNERIHNQLWEYHYKNGDVVTQDDIVAYLNKYYAEYK